MAVHLKKRACEQFSNAAVQKPPNIKRLKLTKLPQKSQDSVWENRIIQIDGTDSQTILDGLYDFSKAFPIPADEISRIILALVALYRKQNDAIVKIKIAQLLGSVCQSVGYNSSAALKSLIQLMENEKSNQVISQLWKTALQITRTIPNDSLVEKLCLLARKTLLNNDNAQTKCQCLLFIAYIARNNVLASDSKNLPQTLCNEQKLIGLYFKDPQPRVRSSALEAMIILHEKGRTLDHSIYSEACKSLYDDYELVRLLAVKLVWIMSQIYPDKEVDVSNCGEKLRLVDDAFANICNMVNDSSVKVRATATQLLGSMHNITSVFLYQTLDKKIMSDLKRKKSLNEKAKERYVEEYSSGTKWSTDGPKEVDLDAAQLMSSGACGAFVHGLEDEMMEVRTAAVDSLTELACQCTEVKFPQSSLDSLVDCLNDEIESVRLNAVCSLHKIMDNVTLLEDQLENVLSAMEDASVDIRYGIHKLLSKCTLMSKFCLHNTNTKLQKNLLKYPNDKKSIWEAYKYIGKHHSQLVYLLVPTLLSCHAYFDTPEPKMDDPGYIGQLILVFNAAEQCPKLTQIFPGHVIRHYQYLRDSLPDLVPQGIKMITYANNNSSSFMSPPRSNETKSDPKVFLTNALMRNKNLHMHDPSIQRTLLQCTISDLEHVATIAPSLSAMALCSARYFKAQLLLSQVADTRDWSGTMLSGVQQLSYAKPIAMQVKSLTRELEHLFIGLSIPEVALLKQIYLKAVAVEYLSDFQELRESKKQTKRTSKQPANFCQEFFKVIQNTEDYLKLHDITGDVFSKTVFAEVLKLDPSKKQSLIAKFLQPLLLHSYNISVSPLSSNVREVKATLTLPKVHNAKTIYFKAGLAVTLDVEGVIENSNSPIHEVIVMVQYPDGKDQIVNLKPCDVKKTKPYEHMVNAKLILRHVQWTDVSKVKIMFCKKCGQTSSASFYDDCKFLPISAPSEISIQPKGSN